MATTINESDAVVTVIDVFVVKPHEQSTLIELLERATVDTMQYLDGFLSSNIHRGLDGEHVAIYAQWAGRQHYDAMLAHPKVQEHMRIAATLGRSTRALYAVDSVCGK